MAAWRAKLGYWYQLGFAKPAHERVLLRAIWEAGVARILELGLGNGQRAKRLIELAQSRSPEAQIAYSGIDLFEMRKPEHGAGMSLKLAHRHFTATGARVRLLPGDPFSALSAAANSLGPHDLVLIGADQNAAALEKTWFYVPRVLSPEAQVFVESRTGDEPVWEPLARQEIERRAVRTPHRRAA
ncbi:MAG: hypothetical protein JSS27_17730 [Planctomycetes bacterium]|nr:hypothetical protein [Planctomycetota bacterium]